MAHVSLTAGRPRAAQADAVGDPRARIVTAARHDLVAAMKLRDQKLELRVLAGVRVREAYATANAAGIGRRESPAVRTAEEDYARAQRNLDLATHDVALALAEFVAQVAPAAVATAVASAAPGPTTTTRSPS
jgi:hypothetical protein